MTGIGIAAQNFGCERLANSKMALMEREEGFIFQPKRSLGAINHDQWYLMVSSLRSKASTHTYTSTRYLRCCYIAFMPSSQDTGK